MTGCTVETFVFLWRRHHGDVHAIARDLDRKVISVRVRARRLRQRGVDLPHGSWGRANAHLRVGQRVRLSDRLGTVGTVCGRTNTADICWDDGTVETTSRRGRAACGRMVRPA